MEHRKDNVLWDDPPVQPCGTCGMIVERPIIYYHKPTQQTFCDASCGLEAYKKEYAAETVSS